MRFERGRPDELPAKFECVVQSWETASDDGRSQQAIKRAVYLYLRRNDRLDEIPLIWGPEGKVEWVTRRLSRRAALPPLAPVTCRPS